MIQEITKKISIIYNGDTLVSIDSDSPVLTDIVNKVILNENVDLKLLECQTDIIEFDTKGFLEIIKDTVSEIREKLKINTRDYDEILKSINQDQKVEEFYESLVISEKEENV